MTNDELLHKWVEGTISEEELKTFQQRPEYPSLVELYKNTDGLAAPKFDEDAVLSNILASPKNTLKVEKSGHRTFLSTWMKLAIAASFLLIAGWFLLENVGGQVHYQMAKGEHMEGSLPDESMFVLNAESSLSYDKKGWENNRELSLEGEAFFEVKKGSTFTVKTPNGSVQVLGTQFNVWSRNEIFEVKCQTGKVAILTPDGNKIDELNPNEGIRIEPGKSPEKWKAPSNSISSWKNGISKFRKVSLAIVLEELERQFDVQVNTGNVKTDETISCNFQHENLDLALKTILLPLNIQYEIKDEKTVNLIE